MWLVGDTVLCCLSPVQGVVAGMGDLPASQEALATMVGSSRLVLLEWLMVSGPGFGLELCLPGSTKGWHSPAFSTNPAGRHMLPVHMDLASTLSTFGTDASVWRQTPLPLMDPTADWYGISLGPASSLTGPSLSRTLHQPNSCEPLENVGLWCGYSPPGPHPLVLGKEKIPRNCSPRQSLK